MKKVFDIRFGALLSALCVALVPDSASAQPALANAVGSSGTLAAAALETTGYYYQSFLLDAFLDPFNNSIGPFIYIIGALIALGSFLLMGRFKFAAWMLMGPTLFFAVVMPRTETDGVDWIWGNEQRQSGQAQAQAQRTVAEDKGVTDTENYNLRVSSMFAWYNNLISDSVREIVKAINSDSTKRDTRFLMRAELFSSLKAVNIREPAFSEFVQLAMLGRCRQVMEAGREYRMMEPPQRGADGTEDDKTWPNNWIVNGPPADNNLLCNVGGAFDPNAPQNELGSRTCQKKIKYRDLMNDKIALTDPQWEYLARMFLDYQKDVPELFSGAIRNPTDIKPLLEKMKEVHLEPPAQWINAQRQVQLTQTVQHLKGHFTAPWLTGNDVIGTGLDCREIWNITYIGLFREAMLATDSTADRAEQAGIDRDQVLKQWTTIAGSEPDADPNLPTNLYRIVAQSVFRNELSRPTTSAFLAGFVERSDTFSTVEIPGENDMALTERVRIGQREYQEKTQMMHYAASMPYYQGLALFFLSILFPFFALLLLIPGKHSGFLLWFSMWLWVKSWDIGYAVVMLLDDALFSMMVARNYDSPSPKNWRNPAENMSDLDVDMSTAIYVLQEADPTFQLGTYYAIIGIALSSIPMVSSYLLLGSLRGGAGIIAEGMKNYASVIGQGAGNLSMQQGVNAMRSGAMQDQMVSMQGAIKSALRGPDGGAQRGGVSSFIGVQGGNLRSGNWRGMALGDHRNGAGSNLTGDPTSDMLVAANQLGAVGGFAGGWSEGGLITRTVGTAEKAIDGINRAASTAHRANDRANRNNNGRRGRVHRNISSTKNTMTSNIAKGAKGKAGGVMGIVDNAVARPVATVALQGKKSMLKIRDVNIDKVVAWAKFDSLNSRRVQNRSAIARIYGALEIPWSDPGGFDAEIRARITVMQETMNMAAAGAEAVGQVVDGAMGGVTDMRKRK